MQQRRFYVAPRPVWHAHSHLFHSSAWIQISSELVLISARFHDGEHGQRNADLWHSHEQVARLAHPDREATVPLRNLHSKAEWAHKKYTADHHAALKQTLALDDTGTVWDVHRAAQLIKPDVCLDQDTY